VNQAKVFCCAGYEAEEFKKIISTETILTQGYEFPLNDFQLSGVNRHYRVSYRWGTLRFGGLSRAKYNINTLKNRKGIGYNSYWAQTPYELGENVVYVCMNKLFLIEFYAKMFCSVHTRYRKVP